MMKARTPYGPSRWRRDPKRGLTSRALYGAQGRPGDYDELIYGDSGVLERATRMRTLLGTLSLVVEPLPDETALEGAFRARCTSVLAEMAKARDSAVGLSGMLEGLGDAVYRGYSLWNCWFAEDPDTEWGYRLHYAKIHASTVDSWEFDAEGYVVGIRQSTLGGSVEIADDELVHVVPWDDEGPEGIALLRPFLFLFEVKKQILFELGRRASMQAGIPVGSQGPRADEGAAQEFIASLDAVVDGEASYLVLPEGWAVDSLTIPAAMELMPVVTYIDDRISQMFDDVLSALAGKVQGSRALGEVVADEADWAASQLVDYLLEKFARALFGFIANAVGYRGRYPGLSASAVDMLGAGDALARAQTVSQLVGLREGDEDALREHAGLAPAREAGSKIEPPAASMPVAFSRSVNMARDNDPRVPQGYDADVEWDQVASDRERAEDRLYAEVNRLANAIRAELAAGTADRARWIPEIQDVYYEYFTARQDAMTALAEREAERQAARGRVLDVQYTPGQWATASGTAVAVVAAVVLQYSARLAAQADLAAANLWRRLEQEAGEIRVFGRPDLPTTADGKALAQDARHAGRIAEQIGRFEGAIGNSGLVPVRLIRSGFEDQNRCDHCEREAGVVVDLLTTAPEDIPTLPDPRCAGTASRCRCGWLVIYGRRAEAS